MQKYFGAILKKGGSCKKHRRALTALRWRDSVQTSTLLGGKVCKSDCVSTKLEHDSELGVNLMIVLCSKLLKQINTSKPVLFDSRFSLF